MKTIAITLTLATVGTLLTGCAGSAFSPTPQYDQAVQRARQGKPEDVKYCQYEASKIPATSNNYNMVMQAVENQEQQMRVFNACMQYRAG